MPCGLVKFYSEMEINDVNGYSNRLDILGTQGHSTIELYLTLVDIFNMG